MNFPAGCDQGPKFYWLDLNFEAYEDGKLQWRWINLLILLSISFGCAELRKQNSAIQAEETSCQTCAKVTVTDTNGWTLRIRDQPRLDATILSSINQGSQIEVSACSAGDQHTHYSGKSSGNLWYETLVDGKKGYLSTLYATCIEHRAAEPAAATAASSDAVTTTTQTPASDVETPPMNEETPVTTDLQVYMHATPLQGVEKPVFWFHASHGVKMKHYVDPTSARPVDRDVASFWFADHMTRVFRQLKEQLGVQEIVHIGIYNYRAIASSTSGELSRHSYAMAIDLMGFRFADGQYLTVQHDWQSARLKQVFSLFCSRMDHALSPDYDKAHYNHFHIEIFPPFIGKSTVSTPPTQPVWESLPPPPASLSLLDDGAEEKEDKFNAGFDQGHGLPQSDGMALAGGYQHFCK